MQIDTSEEMSVYHVVKHGVEILDTKCTNDVQKYRTVSGLSFGVLNLVNLYVLRET